MRNIWKGKIVYCFNVPKGLQQQTCIEPFPNYHDKNQFLEAAESFLVSGVPLIRTFIVKLWEKSASL